MMNKSLRGADRESSRNRIYGFRRSDEDGQKRGRKRQKKSRRFRRLLKLITGRRQTEWTGATRCPNEDDQSHNRESLTDRKRTIFFRLRFHVGHWPSDDAARFLHESSLRTGTHNHRWSC